MKRLEATLQREFAAPWELIHPRTQQHSQPPAGREPAFHHHHVNDDVIEFHRNHHENEPPLTWHSLPVWTNRPVQPVVDHDYRIMLALAALAGIGALAGAFMPATQPGWLAYVCFAAAYIAGGWFATIEVAAQLRHRKIDVHFLMLVVAVGAVFVNALAEGAALLFLFSLSGALEQLAHHRTQKTISSLLKDAPKKALRRANGGWLEISIEDVNVGDELLVKPGELFPVDGELTEGRTSADESALTGESMPVTKNAGDSVSGGTLNIEGQAVIRVVRLPGESAVQRILALIENAQLQKAPTQRFTDKFSSFYTWFVLAMSVCMLVMLLKLGKPLPEAFYRTMTLLVVASPCALVLSIPSAVLVAIAVGARNGILFRGGAAVENLAAVNQFAFDKTGTLTRGALRISRIELLGALPENELLRLAASIAQFSTHPLSRAIAEEAKQRGLAFADVVDFKNIPGLGVEAAIETRALLMGSRKLLNERGIAIPRATESVSEAEVWLAGPGLLGVIYLSDEVRAESRGVVQRLRESGMGVALLTGDRAAAANLIASKVGIDDVRPEMKPDDKLACIRAWQAEGKKVAMVGDGINDAPSLTAADVAIAMGARGADAALEQADVVLMHDRIENVEGALLLSRRACKIIRQNLIVSLGVVLVLVISALAQKINLSVGVIGHEGSTVLVVLNGLRLLRFKR
jgi:Cd2+/Zn2+-exporting ATPase